MPTVPRTNLLTRTGCSQDRSPAVVQVISEVLVHGGYFPSHERWDIDHQGRVLAAADRNEYRITVYGPDGSIAFTFGRDFKPWKRTEKEKEESRNSLAVLRDGERLDVAVDVEDAAPAIVEIHVMDDGEIWVLPTGGQRGQREGVM